MLLLLALICERAKSFLFSSLRSGWFFGVFLGGGAGGRPGGSKYNRTIRRIDYWMRDVPFSLAVNGNLTKAICRFSISGIFLLIALF